MSDSRKTTILSVGLFLGALVGAALWQKPWTFGVIPFALPWVVFYLAGSGLLVAAVARFGQGRALPFLWCAFLAQWLSLFRPNSWSLGLLAGLVVAWLVQRRGGWRMALAFLITGPFTILAAYERASGGISPEAIAAILQTNGSEGFHFVLQLMTFSVVFMLFLMAAVLIMIQALAAKAARTAFPPAVWVLGLLVLVLGSAGQVDRALATYKVIKAFREEGPTLAVGELAPEGFLPGGPGSLDIVLIIGESNSKWHWQLYGYPAETNPELAAGRDDLILFPDMISTHTHTVPVLNAMMYRPYTGRDPVTGAPRLGRVSLVSLLKANGIETEWHSAQEPFGLFAGNISRMAGDCDVHRFYRLGSGGSMPWNRGGPDPDVLATEAIMGGLNRPSTQARRLLVYHMQAGHWPYGPALALGESLHSMPLGKAFFGGAKDLSSEVRAYDRAIRFVDHQVARIIKAADLASRPTLVVFCPDHGESPEDGSGHDSSRHSARQVEIPFLVHANPALKREAPELPGRIASLRTAALTNSCVFEFVTDLYGLRSSRLRRDFDPLLEVGFTPPPRVVFEGDRPLYFDRATGNDGKDANESARVNVNDLKQNRPWSSPLYAHRVNSIGKALEAKRIFDGIEMDVVFDVAARTFFVYHPPLPNPGLRLEDQLAAVADRKNLRIWLDFKNPESGPNTLALAALEALDARAALKGRCLVELPSSLPAETFKAYARAGWTTSMYVPPGFSQAPGSDESRNSAYAQALVEKALAGRVTFLSFNYADFDEVQRYLIPRKKSLGLLSWTWIDSAKPGFSVKMRKLQALDGYIVTFRSPFEY